jgi:hypothetical protein
MMGHGAGVLGFIMVLFVVGLSIFLLVKDKKDKKVYFNDMTEGFGNDNAIIFQSIMIGIPVLATIIFLIVILTSRR